MRRLAIVVIMTAIVASLTARSQPPQAASALEAMAGAERAFAATALQKGIRDAFVEYFADDSIGFYPTPTNARAFYKEQPPTPLSRRLQWEPRTGDVARSGDLGWLTGPYSLQNTETRNPPSHGCYFSIWKKQADGSWKVLMDIGVHTPGPAPFAPGFVAVGEPKGRYQAAPSTHTDGDALLQVDREFAQATGRTGADRAYAPVLTAVSRLHVPEHQPIVGSEAILAWLKEGGGSMTFVPEAAGVAASADLGFTRGSYEEKMTTGGAVSKGYYARTWKRASDGRWTMAVEVRNPLPPPEKP